MCYYNNGEEFDKIYNKYYNYIFRCCYSILKNTSDSEEVTQTTFAKLVSQRKNFENEENVKAWLIKVAKNQSINMTKSWWKSKRKDADIAQIKVTYKSKDAKYDELHNKISILPSKYKEPLLMHYFQGYDLKSISNKLHINENTVKTNIKRGKEKIKKFYFKEGGNK